MTWGVGYLTNEQLQILDRSLEQPVSSYDFSAHSLPHRSLQGPPLPLTYAKQALSKTQLNPAVSILAFNNKNGPFA